MDARLNQLFTIYFSRVALCYALCLATWGGAQSPGAYPLPRGFAHAKSPAAKINLLLRQTDSLKSQSPETAIYYAQVADSLALQYGKRFASAQSAFWLAWMNHYEGKTNSYQSALADAQICIDRLKKTDPPFWLARSHALLAAIYLDEGQRALANEQVQLALRLVNQVTPKRDSLRIRGLLHSVQGVYEESRERIAEQHFLQAIADYREAGESIETARAYKNYALHLFGHGNFAAADQAFQKAIVQFRQNGALNDLRKALLPYALRWTMAFYHSNNHIDYFHKAVDLTRQALDLNPDLETYYQMGYTYHTFALKYEKEALGKIYLDSVQYYYSMALGQATNSIDFENIQNLARNLDRLTFLRPYVYSTISDLIPAYDKLLATERQATERAKWRLQLHEKAKYRSRMIFYGMLAALIFLLAGVVVVYFFYRRKLKFERTRAQLWQTRLKPHFISNALNSIDALVRLKKDRIASEYIVKFNRFCRNVLEASDQYAVSLHKELETMTLYLELEKLRLGDRLSYHFDVDQRIDLKATQIPLFLLQPFLENAIWHGIHPKAEGGTVELRMQKWSNRVIRIEIQDDGVGRSADKKRTERDQDRRSWGKDISDQLLQRFNRSRLIPVELKDGINGTGTQVTIYLTERRYPSKGGAKTGQ